MLEGKNLLFKGAGDFASGSIRRTHLAGARVVATELESPLSVRREVSFSEAVYRGSITVEGVTARLARLETIDDILDDGMVAVVVDPDCRILRKREFDVLVDATMAKRNTGTMITDASVVIALGPGFRAGKDCHAVVETLAGHDIGRVIYDGYAAENTGVPSTPEMYLGACGISGRDIAEAIVLRAPSDGYSGQEGR